MRIYNRKGVSKNWVDEKTQDEIYNMINEGRTIDYVCRATNRHKSTIVYYKNKFGLTNHHI